ncbi:MAG: serine/threonine protein kinase, partial [Planctomycetota bacterium]
MSDDMKEPQDAGPSPYGDAPADETATSFDADALSHPIASSGMEAGPTPPENIGRYRVVRQLGEGGFGTVYLAEQSEPVRRKVAIKIIKPGMSTKGVIARFEAERQALAMMDHPCVARVFDAGVTDEPGGGRPYFVMEYVAGVPITEHCDRGKLPVTDRLELFMQVCEAVQHAHQKGIIHRDLKPSNMLITTIDGKAAPRVIDFGIAKALHQKLTDETMCTEVGQIIGTREYMSPEQAETGSIDIDTRSDIYALGVLLYELLAGWRPFESDTLRKAGQAEIQRILREVDPPRPSTRLTTRASTSTRDAEVAAQIASTRQTDLRSLTSMLRSDLDWVVMKCLEKDRERRYESASALAGELERFLKNEPVLAGPPSVGYRFGKFARRNRVAMTAAAVILLALVGATAVSTGFAIKTNLALADRDAALDAERTQRSLAEKRETEANAARAAETLRAAELEQVAGFQASQLGGVDPDGMGVAFRLGLRGKLEALARRRGLASDAITALLDEYDLVVAGADFTGLALQTLDSQVFQPALASIERQFATQPRVRSRLLQAIATAMFEAGLWEAATAPQEEALALRRAEFGSEHADTLHSLQQTANLWRERGDHARARSMYDEVLQTRRRVLGEEHVDTITSLASIGGLDLVEGDLEQAA